MIYGFKEETKPLTEDEKEILSQMIRGLKNKTGEDNAIKSGEMIKALKFKGYKINGARLRKLINHIRVNKLILNLISSSKGYWIENDPERVGKYVVSLQQRIDAITELKQSFNY